MPVPSLVTDLSATIASNSPAGSDNVFPDLDGYLRSLSGFLASIRDNSGNGWVSPYLTAANPSYTGTFTGGTGVVNLGSGQFYKSATGDVGIGTASPASYGGKLNVYAGDVVVADAGTSSGASAPRIGSAGQALIFKTNTGAGSAAEVARFDGAGNLGLGVVPSAWGASGQKAFQLAGLGAVSGGFDYSISASNNAMRVSGGGWQYMLTGQLATLYQQISGTHTWSTAPSGTAGNAISFTQAMTLHASGGLAVGTTSDPGANNIGIAAGGKLYYSTNAWITPEDNTIGARISGSAVVGFWTGGSERARITSGGDLLVGQVGSGPININGVAIGPANTGGIDYNHLSGTASGIMYARFNLNATTIGSITQSGTTAVLYNTTSDQRLKTNIVDAPDASALIDSIKVRSFDWISDDSHQRYGMVAQELFEVAPEAVHAPADPDEMMAVDYSKLVPMLVKEIQSLRARVAALEA